MLLYQILIEFHCKNHCRVIGNDSGNWRGGKGIGAVPQRLIPRESSPCPMAMFSTTFNMFHPAIEDLAEDAVST